MMDKDLKLTPREVEQIETELTGNDLILFCPKCGQPVTEKWSGVECSSNKCDWWFCL
jgi:hypothetical protein